MAKTIGIKKHWNRKRSPASLRANGARTGKAAADVLTSLKTLLMKLHFESPQLGREHAVL
jgi:hypothetical protein